MKPAIGLTRALTDPQLFGKTFAAASFWTWRCVAKLIDGVPLEGREIDLFKRCTGRSYNRRARRGLRRAICFKARNCRPFSICLLALLCATPAWAHIPGAGSALMSLWMSSSSWHAEAIWMSLTVWHA
jgi:hypothetical protein